MQTKKKSSCSVITYWWIFVCLCAFFLTLWSLSSCRLMHINMYACYMHVDLHEYMSVCAYLQFSCCLCCHSKIWILKKGHVWNAVQYAMCGLFMREICIQWMEEGLYASINYFGGSAASLRDADVSQSKRERMRARESESVCVVKIYGDKKRERENER